MLINSLLLTATAGPLLLASQAFAAPATTSGYRISEHHSEDGSVTLVEHDNYISKRAFKLDHFSGCDQDDGSGRSKKDTILATWHNMLEMANKIHGKVDFNEGVAVDYLGNPKDNKQHQDNIRKIIDAVQTFTLSDHSWNWHMSITCDDPVWKRTSIGASPSDICPPGASKDDFTKCGSRCWVAQTKPDGSLRNWRVRALAYTTNERSTNPVARINWCPGFFDLPSCNDAVSKNSRDEGHKWDMTYYQCKEQAMVHEMFHVDPIWSHHGAGDNGHIMDRKIKIGRAGDARKVLAYGPFYTKVLARWTIDVGKYVSTNADSLAWYFIGKWIKEDHGYYPSGPRPEPSDVPSTAPTKQKRQDQTPDVWDPIVLKDGEVQFGDMDDVADALGVDSYEDALEMHVVADENLDCHDSYIGDDGEEHCFPEEVLELDGNKNTFEPSEPSCESDNDCSSPTCIGGGVAYTCVEGSCKCAVPAPPEPSDPEPEPTDPPKSDIEVPSRPNEGFALYAWPGAKCSDVKPWDLTNLSGRAEDVCRTRFVGNNWERLNCVAGNVADKDYSICVYTGDDCTGDVIEIRRDDIEATEVRFVDDGTGYGRELNSYTIKKGSC